MLLRLLPAIFTTTILFAADVDRSASQKDAAVVISASGQISTTRKGQDWAIAPSERIWIRKPIVSGPDGYANFCVAGGTTFEVFAHTRVVFRENPGNAQDLLDLETGRVRVQLSGLPEQHPVRIKTPIAIISSHGPAVLSIAVDDEDGSARVDVEQGTIMVQHALLPASNPVIVGASDAIAIQADEPLISRKLDRGSMYRDAFRHVWNTIASAMPGRILNAQSNLQTAGQVAANTWRR